MRRGSMLLVGVTSQQPAGALVELRPRASFEVEGLVQIMRSASVTVDWDARLRVGSHTYLNAGASITCGLDTWIGSGCAIAPGASIMDNDTHTLVVDGAERPHAAPLRMNDNCWIGTGAVILKGVEIGEGSVVAAGAVVVDDVPANTVAAGVPARVVTANARWSL
jgi:acetyltransferase-like isoleucine patch superfamily enzyme